MPKPRNYQAEYARRLERGLSSGLSKSQARGHPKALEAAKVAAKYEPRIEEGVKAMRGGKSLAVAARENNISPERLRSYVGAHGIGEKSNGRWQLLKDLRTREMLLYTKGGARKVTVSGYEPAREIGAFMGTVSHFLSTGDAELLAPFRGKSVTDAKGKTHPFETDPNSLYMASDSEDESFERIYKIVL